jgi:hypothetical protein
MNKFKTAAPMKKTNSLDVNDEEGRISGRPPTQIKKIKAGQ